MKPGVVAAIVLSLAIFHPAGLGAQSAGSGSTDSSRANAPQEDQFHGFNAYASFSGLVTGSGSLLKLDSSVGYDFNRNFGVFAGTPLYLNNGFDSSSKTGSIHVAGAGDAYIGAELYLFPKAFRYSTSVTVGLPTGNVAKGFSPGVVTADWSNRFRRSFGKLTPEVNVGIANTLGIAVGSLPSSGLIDGSLAATGTFVHVEEGAEFDVAPRVYVGAEGYHILPLGAQSPSTGNASTIVQENGLDTWIGFLPNHLLSTELGYSRSVSFTLNSLSFRLGVNVGRLLRRDHAR
jgi:hypothetical protein